MKNQQKVKQKDAIKMLKMISEGNYQFNETWNQAQQNQFPDKKQNSNKTALKHKIISQRKIITEVHTPSQEVKNIFRKRVHKNLNTYSINRFRTFKHSDIQDSNKIKENQHNSQQHNSLTSRQHVINLVIDQQHGNESKIKSNLILGDQISNQLRTQGSQDFIIKVGKISRASFLLKQPQEKLKAYMNNFKQQKQRERANAINQLIKNKIRRKKSRQLILRKNSLQSATKIQEKPHKRQSIETVQQKAQFLKFNLSYQQSKQAKLLKNWLDSNRFKRKRSIASLLRQHLQNKSKSKSKQKQKQILKNMQMIKSARMISLTTHKQNQLQ